MYEKLYSQHLKLLTSSDDSNFIRLNCPFTTEHKQGDKHASAGFDKHNGVFNCFVCGSMSPSKFFGKFLHDEQEGQRLVEHFRGEEHLIEFVDTFTEKIYTISPQFEELAILAKQYMNSDESCIQTYMKSRQLDYNTLLHYNVGYLPAKFTNWKRDSIVFPYYLDDKVVGIRYRDCDCNKGGEKDCHFTLWGVDNLVNVTNNVAILVEGDTDNLRTYQALKNKYVVVSTPTATFQKIWVREFEDIDQVIYIPQEDEASILMTKKVQQFLGDKVTIIPLPWKKREYGKDVCDWLRNRTDEDLCNLIESNIIKRYNKVMTGQDLRELAENEQQWIIKGLLAKRQACFIIGGPKVGKTWLAMNMIRCLLIPGECFCGIPELTSEIRNPKILFIEEEGNLTELKIRADKVLKGIKWESNTFWMHHLSMKLDNPSWVEKLIKTIKELKIDVMFIDPFQRTHNADENDSSAMGLVWNSIDRMLSIFPHLAVIIIHHTKKTGDISDGWNCVRGSSRLAAEADLGIFVDKLPKSHGIGIKMNIDGRSIIPITGSDNSNTINLSFQDGIYQMGTGKVFVEKPHSLSEEVKNRLEWGLLDAAVHYAVNPQTIKNWVTKCPDIAVIKNKIDNKSILKYMGVK